MWFAPEENKIEFFALLESRFFDNGLAHCEGRENRCNKGKHQLLDEVQLSYICIALVSPKYIYASLAIRPKSRFIIALFRLWLAFSRMEWISRAFR